MHEVVTDYRIKLNSAASVFVALFVLQLQYEHPKLQRLKISAC